MTVKEGIKSTICN